MKEPNKQISTGTDLHFTNPQGNEVSDSQFDRLMTLAVVSQEFGKLLLAKPDKAIEAIAAGYQGEKLNFSPDERQLLLSIKARTLEEFAKQLLIRLETSKE